MYSSKGKGTSKLLVTIEVRADPYLSSQPVNNKNIDNDKT